MPDYLLARKYLRNFAGKTMEYKLKQAEAADMCQSIISVIVGKYIDRIVEAKNDKRYFLSHSCLVRSLNVFASIVKE